MIDVLWWGETDPQVIHAMRERIPEGVRVHVPDRSGRLSDEQAESVQYILNGGRDVGQDLIESIPKLRMIQRLGAGLDGVDASAAERANVRVANLPARNAVAVAEMTIAMAMACARDLPRCAQSMKSGQWLPNQRLSSTFELAGKTWGVIGYGNIGRAVASRAVALGMNVVYYDIATPDAELVPGVRAASLEEVLEASRIVSVHLPLSAETAGLIDERRIGLMPEGSVLIAISRAGVIDDEALLKALDSGHLAGAGVDVWSREPVPAGDPLLSSPRVLATPHVGAQTYDTVSRVFDAAFEKIVSDEYPGDSPGISG